MKKVIRKLIIFILVIGIILVCGFTTLGYINYKQAIKDLSIEDAFYNIENYDSFIEYEQLSESYIDSVIAIEDKRFFTRYGVDYISILNAFITGVMEGKFDQGGSTITQQLSKNIYFDFDRSLIRKFSEVFMTYKIENEYNKKDIFEKYVNIIYFGDGYYGINDASKGYFKKSPNELNLAEASLLAGLPQSPSNYQLSTGYDLAIKRQKQVLNALLRQEYINEKEYYEALEYQFKDFYIFEK